MTRLIVPTLVAALAVVGLARGDELLYSYEGDVFPWEGGWGGSDARCEDPCFESLEDGHFVMRFIGGPDLAGYGHTIARFDDVPPPTLWVEWQFRSNSRPVPFPGCDSLFHVQYQHLAAIVYLHGNAATSYDGTASVVGLDPSQFHTYRYESYDALQYTLSVDGRIFIDAMSTSSSNWSFLELGGFGSCDGDEVNEWDFVRYGTIAGGEQLVGVDPPPGTIAAAEGAQFRSFTLTFDRPAYLYIDDITVSTTGGFPPTIFATKRLDNGPPEVLQVVLRHALPPGETTTFTFDTGKGPQSVSYFREQPEIPATSQWGIVVMALIGLVVGSVTIGAAGSA